MGKKSRKNKGAAGKNSADDTELSKTGENANQESMKRQTKRESVELVNQLLDSKST